MKYHVMAVLQWFFTPIHNTYGSVFCGDDSTSTCLVTTVADDWFYTFHRRHASSQLCRIRVLVINTGFSVDDDDDDNNNQQVLPLYM